MAMCSGLVVLSGVSTGAGDGRLRPNAVILAVGFAKRRMRQMCTGQGESDLFNIGTGLGGALPLLLMPITGPLAEGACPMGTWPGLVILTPWGGK